MRDFAPESLIARLVELRLCTAADVQRARRLVRRMTRDLPAFDSVWVDALTQLGVLTPFQSRCLDVAPPETLIAGDYILLDGFGAGTASQTFLAAGPDRRRVVLKRVSPADHQADAVELRLELLVERSRNAACPQLAAPTGLVRTPDRLFVSSRHVAGLNLGELLIRRGRFPGPVVLSVADQLLIALAAWHASGAAHGDLRLTKLRLTDRGQIVLVDCGLRPALAPELLVHTVQSPEEADVIAPERIGTNNPATAASDLYAAGCVLWQLSTGRSPHPQADPLAKLAAHQSQRIPDVRDLAPETPPRLAEAIHLLTSPHPQDRPASAEAVRRRLGFRGKPRTGGLIRFRRQFDGTVPHLAQRKPSGARNWQGAVAAVALLGIAVVVLSDRGLRTELLEIAQRKWSPPEETLDTPATNSGDEDSANTTERTLSIPEPDAHGVITLTKPGPYRIREITQVGPLTLRAADGVRPRLEIQDAALTITAQHATLQGLDVVWTGSQAWPGTGGLVQLRTQGVHVADCRFAGPAGNSDERIEFAAVAWEPSDRRDPQAGAIEIERTIFTGEMHGIVCRSSPRTSTWRHVLKTGAGSAAVVEHAATAHGLKLEFDRVTLRAAGSLASCSGPLTEQPSASLIEIVASDSVFDLRPSAPLVELVGPNVRADWLETISVIGDGCLLPPGAMLLAGYHPHESLTSELKSDELQFEGLFADDFEFAGEPSADPRDSLLVKTHAPRRSAAMPGVQADDLPGETAKPGSGSDY